MFSHRFCVAPLLDHTTAPCRFLHRSISRYARLYSEMVFAKAVIHNPSLLAHSLHESAQHALQIAGSSPEDLAEAAAIIAAYRNEYGAGYDEINFNCGCPSPRVQSGGFGACLMDSAPLVAKCMQALKEGAPQLLHSLKHRLGINSHWPYEKVRDFVATVAEVGCNIFIVHARIALLNGVSPKHNRSVPPLHYEYVYRLKEDFPDCTFIINGAIDSHTAIEAHLKRVDGVMLGRYAYAHPAWLATVDRYFQDAKVEPVTEKFSVLETLKTMQEYATAHQHLSLGYILKPMTNLMAGSKVAKRFRNMCAHDYKALKKGEEAVFWQELTHLARLG